MNPMYLRNKSVLIKEEVQTKSPACWALICANKFYHKVSSKNSFGPNLSFIFSNEQNIQFTINKFWPPLGLEPGSLGTVSRWLIHYATVLQSSKNSPNPLISPQGICVSKNIRHYHSKCLIKLNKQWLHGRKWKFLMGYIVGCPGAWQLGGLVLVLWQ